MDSNKPVRITNSIPAIVADGHGIGINNENSVANLLFIQINPSQKPETESKELEGSVVSNIRLSLEQLEKLGADIQKTVVDFKASKKK